MNLAQIRARFSRVLAREDIYLANHSLGRAPDQTALDIAAALDLWYREMDGAWTAWQAEFNRWRANTAQLIGLTRPDAIVPKTSAGQGLRAVLNAFPQNRPVRVLTTRGEFDSIDFILKAYASRGRAEVTWVEPSRHESEVPLYSVESLIGELARGGQAANLIVVSLVFFGTGQILQEVERLVAAAHEKGCFVLLDLYHAAGVIPLNFEALGADFAIGGSYKYLRGGPGACWLAIHPRNLNDPGRLRTLDTGWFAKKDTFGYERKDTAEFADGGNGWLESTPPVLMPYQARAGLEFALETGIDQLRGYSLDQQARMRAVFRKQGVKLFEPRDPAQFGAFSLYHHEKARELSTELKTRGVNTDARGDFVRFGPDLLNTDEEFERAAGIVEAAISLLS